MMDSNAVRMSRNTMIVGFWKVKTVLQKSIGDEDPIDASTAGVKPSLLLTNLFLTHAKQSVKDDRQ